MNEKGNEILKISRYAKIRLLDIHSDCPVIFIPAPLYGSQPELYYDCDGNQLSSYAKKESLDDGPVFEDFAVSESPIVKNRMASVESKQIAYLESENPDYKIEEAHYLDNRIISFTALKDYSFGIINKERKPLSKFEFIKIQITPRPMYLKSIKFKSGMGLITITGKEIYPPIFENINTSLSLNKHVWMTMSNGYGFYADYKGNIYKPHFIELNQKR